MAEPEFVPVGIAVLTVSDTRTLAEDRSGDVLAGRIADAGHRVAHRAIVKDDVETIRTHLTRQACTHHRGALPSIEAGLGVEVRWCPACGTRLSTR